MARSFASASLQYLINTAAAPVSTTPMSLAAWFNPVANANGSIIGLGHATGGNRVVLGTDTNGKLFASSADSSSATATSAGTFTTGAWNHAGGSFAADNYARSVYLNGTATAGAAAFAAPTSLSRYAIGAMLFNGSPFAGYYFNGKIAEVGVWNVVLTAEEFAFLAAGASPMLVRPQNLVLVAYHPLFGRTAGTEEDWVGALELTNTNAATVADHPRVFYSLEYRSPSPTTPPAGGTITLVDRTNLSIIQRNGTTGSAAFSGTVSGTVTSVEARIVTTGSLTPVTSWAVVDAAPTTTWSGTVTGIPQGDGYSVQVRPSNNTAAVVTGSATWGVGDFWFVIGQSNGRKFVSDGTGTPASTTRKYSGSAGTAWVANTGAAGIAFANALTAAQGIPIAIGDYALDGTALLQEADTVGYWLNTAANQPYAKFLAGINSVGGKCAGIIWDQGQKEGSLSGSVTKAEYKSGLQTFLARVRSDLGQANLPILIAPLGRYTGGSTDAAWQGVRDAQHEVAAEANNYLALQTYDVELAVDGVHYSTGSTGFLRYGTRVGLRAKEVLGLTTNSRGPYIVSASYINSTTIDVTFALRGGTTITPASGVTIIRVVDGAGVNAVVSTTRLSATKMRVVVTSALTGTIIVQLAYGVNPTVTGTIYDDSSNALPVEATNAEGVTVTRKQVTITVVDRNNVPQASVTGLYGAWFDNPRLDQLVAPTDVFTGLSTNGSGVLTVDIPNSALSHGQVGRLIVDKSDGTTTQSPSPVGSLGPATVVVS